VVLDNLGFEETLQVGYQCGEFFRKMNEAKHILKGFGYLTWNGETVEGQLQTDVSVFMKEENEEYAQDYEEICQWNQDFARGEIKAKLEESLAARMLTQDQISFTNQDTSPENILYANGKVSLIDPVPILYYGHSFAGNFMNNYEVLFPSFHNTPRYEKHQFNQYEGILKQISNGFYEGYAQGDQQIKQLIKREQFIQLFALTFNHYKLATNELTKEQLIRYGTQEAIKGRIPVLLNKLTAFQLDKKFN
jgi:hypothetical protein